MAKYLLSDGSVTNDKYEELIDRFVSRLKLYSNSVPRSNNNGIVKTFSGIDNTTLMDELSMSISSLARSISTDIRVEKIYLRSGSYYVKVIINKQTYEVTIGS